MGMNSENAVDLTKLLTALQQRERKFQKEKQEIRTDYLIRGICEKEVDGLLETASLFPDTWVPSHLRWQNLCHADQEQLHMLLQEAAVLLYGEEPAEFD